MISLEGGAFNMHKWSFILLAVAAMMLVTSALWATTLTPMEQLGKNLFFDKISSPSSMACANCHAPATGFTGPVAGINSKGAVYPGAVPQRHGNRKPPTASYATLSPTFHYDAGEETFVGGNFWDGRATGDHLGNPAADQAQGPFLNPVEQNMPSKQAVLEVIAASKYADLWMQVWGEPVSWATPMDIDINYDRVGLSIAAYEGSYEVNAFSSKFDMFWRNAENAGMVVEAIDMSNWMDYMGFGLDKNEVKGLALFNDEGKGNCAACHVLDSAELGMPPLFTDFTYDNLGVPKNPDNPFYDEDEVFLDDGTPINPLGDAWIDPGLGGFLANSSNPAWKAMAQENWGKQKVPTLRNVGKRPSEQFIKAYMHNGVFKSLKEVVHFYNTRDVEDWPPPEVAANVNHDELGDLGLNKKEETLIAVFMETLSDGYIDGPKDKSEKDVIAQPSVPEISPNPFNPSTVIKYKVPVAGDVDLSVYNVAGRKVATLDRGWKAANEYSVRFAGRDLPSGIYFLRFALAGTVQTSKMVLLK
jgi:cytochrome c peroxidase